MAYGNSEALLFSTAPQPVHWRPVALCPPAELPTDWRSWLADEGSLTQRLTAASHGHFSVKVLSQRRGRPRPDEAMALGMTSTRRALIREVVLLGNHQPWVYARSILPLTTLSGRLRVLGKLDDRPLGALLFADPTMTRGPVEVATLPGTAIPPPLAPADARLWGRRSVFWLDAKPLLVCEIFLPGFAP